MSSYFIDTTPAGRSATGIKALIYAPGCAIQTFDLPLSSARPEPYSFICQPVRSVSIAGELTRSDRLYQQKIKLQAKYVARWAQPFLGLADEVIPVIPVGDVAYVSEDGGFRISVPDLSSVANLSGELRIWAKNKISGETVALLIPAGPQIMKTHMGGLKVQSEYPAETFFVTDFVPRAVVNPSQLHDREGFALRPGVDDACDP